MLVYFIIKINNFFLKKLNYIICIFQKYYYLYILSKLILYSLNISINTIINEVRKNASKYFKNKFQNH